MKCKFCEGHKGIRIHEYSKFGKTTTKEDVDMIIDCPKCNGTGNEIKE